ncbi:hypothetical protein ACFL0Y_03300 [Patescibacteria group bacterium]
MSENIDYSYGEGKSFLKIITTVFSIFLPIALLTAGFAFLYMTQDAFKDDLSTDIQDTSQYLYPSQVLNNKYRYKDQDLTLRGEVGMESITCRKKDCPEDDSCCGCSQERNVIAIDPGGKILRESGGVFRLLNRRKESYCQRIIDSCDYSCGDWEIGAVYDIDGTFFADPPPRGAGSSLFTDYYFEVLDYNQVEGTGFAEKARRLLSALKDLITGYYGEGDRYVLQD